MSDAGVSRRASLLLRFDAVASADRAQVLTRVEARGAGRVAYVTVNRPQRRNALGIAGKRALAEAFAALAADEQLRVAVLTGAGERSFIAGADIAEMADLTPEEAEAEHRLTHRACEAIRALPVPVIARINGHCLGAGMEIAASCDLRVGTTGARFGLPEVRFGLPAGMEACLVPLLIGWGKTRELVYTGEPMDATEAYRCGFLEKLVEPAQLDAAVEQWVRAVLAGGPRAIRLQKALMRDWERLSIAEAVERGIRACVEARRSDEPQRLMQAFLDRKQRAQEPFPGTGEAPEKGS